MDPQYLADPFTIWDRLRSTCPIPHTDRRKSSWMPLRYDDVTAIAHDIEHFSSLKVAVIPGDEDEDPNEDFDGPNLEYGLPPISADPPLHTWTRRLLLPWFSHTRVDRYVPLTRELCRRLLDGFAGAGQADAAADYAQQIPVRVIARILGVSDRHVGHRSPAGCATSWSSPTTRSGASAAPKGCSTTSSSSSRCAARRTRATTC